MDEILCHTAFQEVLLVLNEHLWHWFISSLDQCISIYILPQLGKLQLDQCNPEKKREFVSIPNA